MKKLLHNSSDISKASLISLKVKPRLSYLNILNKKSFIGDDSFYTVLKLFFRYF